MKILVPTSGIVPAQEKAEYILDIAKRLKADVTVIHILDLGEGSEGEEALTFFSELGAKKDVKVTTYLKEGNVVPTIVDFAESENASMIVMGASEGRIVAEWIVTDVIDKTKIPVVIIPR
ncbi:MAG: universal stress protein [Thermoplasmata archaeon]|nr:MAG: universal stress protein [Thermoplasmata archaeon]